MQNVTEIITPLGADVLLFHRMTAREELGRLSEFEIDLLSTRGDINLDEILAKNITIKMALPNNKTRYFNGYVARFTQAGMQGGLHRYHATLRPWLWFLTRTANCRIFQNLTVPEIIQQVFAAHAPIAGFQSNLTVSYRKWEYCVQYRESDFNFVSRLMEQEGIYYYFKHAEGRHTLVLADGLAAHAPFEDYADIPFGAQVGALPADSEFISEWNCTREIQSGRYVIDDFNFKAPSTELLAQAEITRAHALSNLEIYDYPGEYSTVAEGARYARTRLESLQARYDLVHGVANARGLGAGYRFNLTGHARADQNREYLVLAAVHDLDSGDASGAIYRCSFTALNSRQTFRSQSITPKPSVNGPQTALVVGPAGEEIYTDRYGRVKVQFHWDRAGARNERSSCWIRVSQPWAGKRWGMMTIPRVGQEVIVDFLEGDPDQPIITGRVYNAEQAPPYALPANQTQSGIKTHSSAAGGSANFNELRFEDEKGAEQVFMHAERNYDVVIKNDASHSVGHNASLVIGADRRLSVGRNESIIIGGNQDCNVGASRSVHVGSVDSLHVGKSLLIEAGESITIKTGSASISLRKDGSVTINGTSFKVGVSGEVVLKGAKILQS